MRISIYLNKSIEENAGAYYDRAKTLKKKIERAKNALDGSLKRIDELEKLNILEEENKPAISKKDKKWYEKFRWFISSEGFLVIGGRDATSNEIVVKKHTTSNDIIFHTDMAGSPFFVVKTENKPVGEATMREVADATVTFSRAWKLGLSTTSVFHVTPEQVSKKTNSGEYMGKGAFMIYGKTNHIENNINLAIGILDGAVMAGPIEAVRKSCKEYILIVPGKEKTSSLAKKIQHKLGGELDDIIRALPAGGCEIKNG